MYHLTTPPTKAQTEKLKQAKRRAMGLNPYAMSVDEIVQLAEAGKLSTNQYMELLNVNAEAHKQDAEKMQRLDKIRIENHFAPAPQPIDMAIMQGLRNDSINTNYYADIKNQAIKMLSNL